MQTAHDLRDDDDGAVGRDFVGLLPEAQNDRSCARPSIFHRRNELELLLTFYTITKWSTVVKNSFEVV